jgi:hypothetical protein
MFRLIPVLGVAGLCLLAMACSGYNESPPATVASNPLQTPAPPPPANCPPPAAVPDSIPGVPALPAGTKAVSSPSGLQYYDVVTGTGAPAQTGQSATVQYTGWLVNGTKFDSSVDRNQPFTFPLGGGQVIKGWDEGVVNMKVGGQRRLIIPPSIGYGDKGAGGGVIPACATLIFDVQLVSVK